MPCYVGFQGNRVRKRKKTPEQNCCDRFPFEPVRLPACSLTPRANHTATLGFAHCDNVRPLPPSPSPAASLTPGTDDGGDGERGRGRRRGAGNGEGRREERREREKQGRCVSDKTPQAALMKSLSWRWRDCPWNRLLMGEAAAWCSVQTN